MHSRDHSTESFDAEVENMGTQMYEVMYTGTITVSDSKAPPSIIDEAVRKSKEITSSSEDNVKAGSSSGLNNSTNSVEKINKIKGSAGVRLNSKSMEAINTSIGSDFSFSRKSSGVYSEGNLSGQNQSSNGGSLGRKKDSKQNIRDDTIMRRTNRVTVSNGSFDEENNITSLSKNTSNSELITWKNNQGDVIAMKSSMISQTGILSPQENDRATDECEEWSMKSGNSNRTMLFGVGKRSVTLISPDSKSVILEINFKDISSCAQVFNPLFYNLLYFKRCRLFNRVNLCKFYMSCVRHCHHLHRHVSVFQLWYKIELTSQQQVPLT